MYPSDLGRKFLVQQTVSGTGALSGTEYGRARLPLDPGVGAGGIVQFAAKNYGSTANAITIQYVDAGAGTVVLATTVQQVGPAITVRLKRTALAITATAAEVAAAINAFTAYTAPAYAIRAQADDPTSTTALAVAGPTALAGGAEPSVIGGTQYLWALPTDQDAGLIHLENENPMWVLGFAAKFASLPAGLSTITVSRVRLDDVFRPILTEAVPIFVYSQLQTSAPDVAYTDVRQVIHPGQGILVSSTGPTQGFFNIDVTRAADFPYA
jgi:hypothetical protein